MKKKLTWYHCTEMETPMLFHGQYSHLMTLRTGETAFILPEYQGYYHWPMPPHISTLTSFICCNFNVYLFFILCVENFLMTNCTNIALNKYIQ